MTLTVEDDFRAFLAARWPDLEGVAFVVTLDAATARRVTTDALATLHQHWREALDEGRPGSLARRAVLTGAVAATSRHPAGAAPPPDAAVAPRVPPNPWEEPEDDDPVRTALEAVVRGAAPLERAVVAAGTVWGAGPDEVAELLGMPVADVRDRAATLRGRLARAHDAARAADGLAPADWALDVDLESVVEHLLAGHGDPPDPAALVEDRRRAVQRRSVVVGGAAVVAAGALGWWVVGRRPAAAGVASGSGARPTGLPAATDPSWQSVSQWAPRGRLATDARVQALAISRSDGTARLLFADEVEGRRLVVSATLNPGTEDVILKAWHGSAGNDPAALEEVPLQSPFVAGAEEAMALAFPTAPGTLLLVLGRPTVAEAAYSSTVVPTVEGTVHRDWVEVPVRSGIGATRWEQDPGPALRARAGAFDGAVVGTTRTWVGQGGADALAGFAEETNRFVAAALEATVDSVTTEVVSDLTIGGSVIDPTAPSPSGAVSRVRVLRTTTRGGAVIRSVRVVDDSRRPMSWLDLEPPSVLPAETPRLEPVVLRLEDSGPAAGRFLVIAPGAARVQLLSSASNVYRVSKITPTRTGGAAIVGVVNPDDATGFRLVRWDASGRRLGADVPTAGASLLDLWPGDRTVVPS